MALTCVHGAMCAFLAKIPRNAGFCGEARASRLKSDECLTPNSRWSFVYSTPRGDLDQRKSRPRARGHPDGTVRVCSRSDHDQPVAATKQHRRLIIPKENVPEARLVTGARIAAVSQLTEVSDHLRRVKSLRLIPSVGCAPAAPGRSYPDLADVRGQARARRALEIAAAGQHSMLLVGSPGTGKSMLAERLPGLLPPLSEAEALEVAALASIIAGEFEAGQWRQRPFRAPHHTCSAVALIGGGSRPLPGEISLAHHGVLFLDELPEFDRHSLEALREPLESARIVLSRAAHRAEYPARFQLIAAMNPCPCGALDMEGEQCRCTLGEIQRYQGRISGPLLDRLDIHVRMNVIDPAELRCTRTAETSAVIASRVAAARRLQLDRQGQCNAQLDTSRIQRDKALI